MSSLSDADNLMIERIRQGQPDAWSQLIERFEGRLLAFVRSRLSDRAAAEDVVQETFIGFFTSLPNYDRRRVLESYLFSIAVHKLTDHLRREGRRPVLPLASERSDASSWDLAGSARPASSIVRSHERRTLEERALVAALAAEIEHCRQRKQWERLECVELLLVRGWTNKEVALRLNIAEQAVANYKFEFLARLRSAVRVQDLPADVFPELYEQP